MIELIVALVGFAIALVAFLAIIRIPAILKETKKQTAVLEKILKAVQAGDKNRREEATALLESLSGEEGEEEAE